jgi:uncharacterized protein
MNRIQRTLWIVGSFALALTLLVSTATSAGQLQDRMKVRLPEIVTLKSNGVIGENHQGYLEFVGASRDGADIVDAENVDRTTLYTAVARKTGATVEQVGSRAALKWKENLAPGEYFKNSDGNWIQK